MKNGMRRIIVVVGSGRSGSSVITRGLQVLGVSLGDNLMPAITGVNDKGFWEDQDIYQLNCEIFKALNQDWHTLAPFDMERLSTISRSELKSKAVDILSEKLRTHACFGVKDPQMTRILPLWKEAFADLMLDVSYVITCRSPKNIVRSLTRYTGFDEAKCYMLWYEYALASLLHTNGERRVVVDYDRMMADPAAQLKRIADNLDLTFDPSCREFSIYHDEFLEESLRHAKFDSKDFQSDEFVSSEIKDLYAFLSELAADGENINSTSSISFIADALTKHQCTESVLRNVLVEFENIRAELEVHRAALKTAGGDLISRTEELIASRQAGEQQHALLAKLNTDWSDQAQDLVATRQVLSDRTEQLEKVSGDLQQRTLELVETRNLVVQRTSHADELSKELMDRTRDLVATRQVLSERTEQLEKVSGDLEQRTLELVEVRELVAQRTSHADTLNKELMDRTRDLVETHQTLSDRAEQLEKINGDLERRTDELVEARGLVAYHADFTEALSKELLERTGALQANRQDLVATKEILAERTELLDRVTEQLQNHIEMLRQANSEVSRLSQSVLKRVWSRLLGR